jgi:YqaJ-like viral recombinase domain
MFKYQVLNEFIKKYSHLPEQGTDEWKALRKGFIGGSEVSTILKQNKNKTVSKLILEKLGFDPFKGNAITYWGNVFEEVIRQHCEEIFKCSIRETGSIPYKHGKLSYSPDGLAVVPTIQLQKVLGTLTDDIDETSPTQLVLFEFKCPHTRVPTADIPEYYLPQVSIGMNIIDIMETSVFVQATFRRCSFDQLAYNTNHNGWGHFKKADVSSPPIECGFMIIYADEFNDYHEGLVEAMIEGGSAKHAYNDIVDIGSMTDTSLVEEVFGNCVNKTFKIDYSVRVMYEQRIFDESEYTKQLYDEAMQYRMKETLKGKLEDIPNIIGVMPFKMLNVHITPVAKNPTYIEDTDAHNKADLVLQCIEDHRGIDDKATAQKSIRRYKL